MTSPRQLLPGETYLVTRRTSERRFFLRPSATTNQFLSFLFAYAASHFGIEVHALAVLSNHYHLIASAPNCNLPQFMHCLDLLIAKVLNAQFGRWENLWAPGSYSPVLLTTPEDVLAKMVYVITNPVRSGLVSSSVQWPGLVTLPRDWKRPIGGARPWVFFRELGPVPRDAQVVLAKPPHFAHLADEEFIRMLASAVQTREEELRAERFAAGKDFLGKRAVLRVRPSDAPDSKEPRRTRNPRFAARRRTTRIELIKRLREFRIAYCAALNKFNEGVRDVLFPAGTYWMRVHHGVKCHPT